MGDGRFGGADVYGSRRPGGDGVGSGRKSGSVFVDQEGRDECVGAALERGELRQVTNFAPGRILDFAWTRDGKTLLLAKGEVTRDVVMISSGK